VRVLLFVLLIPLLAAACGGGEAEEEPPAELVGVIVEVNAPNSSIESFTLDADGETFTIYIAPDVDYGFDLAHLHEHRTTREPVRCALEERGERLYALEIVDAPVT
jgi:hypothetical protein